jgi:hypothetical protein
MGIETAAPDGAWVPQSCTLPTTEQPLRVAGFDELFTSAVQRIERAGPDRLRLDLTADPRVAGRAAELVMAETGCCSFFTFSLTASGGRLVLEVTVPQAQAGVLDALAGRAAAAAGRAA